MSHSKALVAKPGFLTVTYRQNPGHLYFQWESFDISLEDCQDAFAQAEQAMERLGISSIVSDVVNVQQELRPEVAQWWGQTCLPSLARCGVKLIVNLLPAAANDGQAASEQTVNGIVMKKAFSSIEAAALLADQRKAS